MKHKFVIFISLFLVSCGRGPDHSSGEIISTQTSQDGQIKALIWSPDLSGSVGISQPYEVWVQRLPRGKKELISSADKTDGIRISWKSPNELDICYVDARILQFRSYFWADDHEIEIMLRKVQQLNDC